MVFNMYIITIPPLLLILYFAVCLFGGSKDEQDEWDK